MLLSLHYVCALFLCTPLCSRMPKRDKNRRRRNAQRARKAFKSSSLGVKNKEDASNHAPTSSSDGTASDIGSDQYAPIGSSVSCSSCSPTPSLSPARRPAPQPQSLIEPLRSPSRGVNRDILPPPAPPPPYIYHTSPHTVHASPPRQTHPLVSAKPLFPPLPDYPASVHVIPDYVDRDLEAKVIQLGK